MNNALQRHLFDFDRVHILNGNKFAPLLAAKKANLIVVKPRRSIQLPAC